MDINVARTFLEVVKTGSFVNAAANLNLTQTAVSARIRVLEEQLDRKVFIRNKAGALSKPGIAHAGPWHWLPGGRRWSRLAPSSANGIR